MLDHFYSSLEFNVKFKRIPLRSGNETCGRRDTLTHMSRLILGITGHQECENNEKLRLRVPCSHYGVTGVVSGVLKNWPVIQKVSREL